jgi:hypothetical protein
MKNIVDFHGMKVEAENYKGVQIIRNSLNGDWMLFFDPDGMYPYASPVAGTLREMKKIVDKNGNQFLFIRENTYK